MANAIKTLNKTLEDMKSRQQPQHFGFGRGRGRGQHLDLVEAVDVDVVADVDADEVMAVFRALLLAEISYVAAVLGVSANFPIVPDRQKIGPTVPEMAPTTIDKLTMVPNHGVNDLKRKVLRQTEALLMLMSPHGEM